MAKKYYLAKLGNYVAKVGDYLGKVSKDAEPTAKSLTITAYDMADTMSTSSYQLLDVATPSNIIIKSGTSNKYAKAAFQVVVGGDTYTQRVNLQGSGTEEIRDSIIIQGAHKYTSIKLAVRSGSTAARYAFINGTKRTDIVTPGTSSVTTFDYLTVDPDWSEDPEATDTVQISFNSGWQLYGIVLEWEE